MLLAVPLALVSSTGGSEQITDGDGGIPAGLVSVFNEAARVYEVNAYLLAAIAYQESRFGDGTAWRQVNSAGCIGLMQMCVGGRAGDSWGAAKDSYRRGRRPERYSFQTERHPDVLDSFDNVMAAAVHLRGKVGNRPIPNLDDLAYRALCGYYGACSDGVAGNYAADVLARAKAWQQAGAAQPPASTSPVPVPALGQGASMSWPAKGPITSVFCEVRAWENCHPGVDIGIPNGTRLLAAAAGRVSVLQNTAVSGGYGNFVCLQHTAVVSSCYAHLTHFLVRLGQTVARGQPIGTSGCTGRCFGPHLHFEVRVGDRKVCPAPYLGAPSNTMCAAGSPGS
jgi:murein DD-endopeptidase MepM/ murein hydrolase activator NlpD